MICGWCVEGLKDQKRIKTSTFRKMNFQGVQHKPKFYVPAGHYSSYPGGLFYNYLCPIWNSTIIITLKRGSVHDIGKSRISSWHLSVEAEFVGPLPTQKLLPHKFWLFNRRSFFKCILGMMKNKGLVVLIWACLA